MQWASDSSNLISTSFILLPFAVSLPASCKWYSTPIYCLQKHKRNWKISADLEVYVEPFQWKLSEHASIYNTIITNNLIY
jgi:hypothetical protein